MWNKWIPFWLCSGALMLILFIAACFAHQNGDDSANWINWKTFWFLAGVGSPALFVVWLITYYV